MKEENLKGILDEDDEEEDFLDDDEVHVTVSSLDDKAIKRTFIGSRKAKSDSEEEESENEDEHKSVNKIAGMEMGREAKAKKAQIKQLTDKEIKSERDLKKLVKFLLFYTKYPKSYNLLKLFF